jgi:hypothetical protein
MTPEDRVGKVVQSSRGLFESSGSTAPVLLEDCTTLIRDPRTGNVLRLSIKAPTAAAFAHKGWQLSYSFAKMNNIVLSDGMGTTVKRTLWATMTDALAKTHLLEKQSGAGSRPLAALQTTMKAIEPEPMPEHWGGWYRPTPGQKPMT